MKDVKRNWITTLFGIFALAISGLQIYQAPAKALDPTTMAQVAAGVGLIAAKDAGKSGTAEGSASKE